MEGGFQVDTARLRKHAGDLRELKTRVDLVVDAGHQVTPVWWDNAYGLLCQGFPLATRPLVDWHLRRVGRIAELLQDAADNLTASADEYDSIENDVTATMRELMDKVESMPPAAEPSGGATPTPRQPNTDGAPPPPTEPNTRDEDATR